MSLRSLLSAKGWCLQSLEHVPTLQWMAGLCAKPRKQGDSHLVPSHAPQHSELGPTSPQGRKGRVMQYPSRLR